MTGNRDLLNTSLARFFLKNIRNLEGRPLYDAVNIIHTVFPPDPAFIPVLLDYAIESDYVVSYKKSACPGRKPIIFYVFITTSQALYNISDKKIGMCTLPWDWVEYRDKEKVINQWHDTYEKSVEPDLIKKGVITE
jgi:hypothetical protein